MAIYSGDSLHAQSVSNSVAEVVAPILAVPPRILELLRFGYHAQPTSLVLDFTAALDATTAQDVRNYRIELLGSNGQPLKGRSIPIRAAYYNPSTFSITLEPAMRLNVHYRYRLTVNGMTLTGVGGASGLAIDGQGTGQAGLELRRGGRSAYPRRPGSRLR